MISVHRLACKFWTGMDQGEITQYGYKLKVTKVTPGSTLWAWLFSSSNNLISLLPKE